MRRFHPELIAVNASAGDGATYFKFSKFELVYWPNGGIIVKGVLDAETADNLTRDISTILDAQLDYADFDALNEQEPDGFDAF